MFDKAVGELLMSGGSPGGAAIIHYTAKTLYGVFNWHGGSLRARGAEVREMNMTSGLQAITPGNAHGKKLWMGGADPRREGMVMGD